MRFLRLQFLILFFGVASAATAQYMDTLRTAFASKKSLDLGFDSRNSFVDHNRINVQSIKLGVEFGKKVALGLGYAWLSNSTPVIDKHSFYDGDLHRDTFVNRQLSFNYFRFYVNYIYYKSRRWEFSIPLQAGIGRIGYRYDYNGRSRMSDGGFCFLYEPEVDVQFKVFRWLGVEGDLGYRFLFKDNKFIKNTFNSPIVSFGVFIVWDEIALMAFPKNKWVQNKFGPSEWETGAR